MNGFSSLLGSDWLNIEELGKMMLETLKEPQVSPEKNAFGCIALTLDLRLSIGMAGPLQSCMVTWAGLDPSDEFWFTC